MMANTTNMAIRSEEEKAFITIQLKNHQFILSAFKVLAVDETLPTSNIGCAALVIAPFFNQTMASHCTTFEGFVPFSSQNLIDPDGTSERLIFEHGVGSCIILVCHHTWFSTKVTTL